MRRVIAGLHLRRAPGPTEEKRVAAALPDEAEHHVIRRAGLCVAHTGPALPAAASSGDALCLLDGEIYDGGPRDEAGLAEAYAREGAAMIARLRGDFLLVLARPGEDPLVARDHMGGRLLVWHGDGRELAFACEFRYLLRLLRRTPDPDTAAMGHWLAVSGLPGERTLFAGVNRLQAGSLLRLGESARPERYWSPSFGEQVHGEPGELAAMLRTSLERAVARRSTGAASAVMLSGGLDSGSVAALASTQAPMGASRAYSATFPKHPSVDESELIEGLRAALGLPGVVAEVSGGSVIGGSLDYFREWRLPPVSPNLFFWMPLLRRAGADGVSVMLDGEGGDELFGLSVYLLADRLRAGRVASMLRLIYRIPGADGHPPLRSVLRFVRGYAAKGAIPPALHDRIRRRRGASAYAPSWLRPEVAAAYFDTDDLHDWRRERDPRWFSHLREVVTRGMGASLAYDHVRRRAALAGLEPRHPLVDADVIELVLRMPPEAAFHPAHSRPLLREAVKGTLPDQVRLRPSKSSFDAVFHESLSRTDLPRVRELLCDPGARVGAYADLGGVRRLVEAVPSGGRELQTWAIRVWRLVTAECWLRSLEDHEGLERIVGGTAADLRVADAPIRGGSTVPG